MEKVIRIHSVISLITNSSTEIFISADNDAIEIYTKVINDILAAGGSDKTFDDLYTAELKYDDYVRCPICDGTAFELNGQEECSRCNGQGEINDPTEEEMKEIEEREEQGPSKSVIIKLKEGSDENIANTLFNVYDINERYD